MSIQSLVPANSVAAMSTAVNTFKRYLASETVTIDGLNASILSDPSGTCFVAVMEKFAMHLAYLRGGNGEFLSKNSVIAYYRQVKKWLLGFFASQKANVDDKLLGMARTLEKHCMTRVKGGLVKKATACKKGDLKLLMEHIYSTATSATDYQDAALVCLMWHVFGRASDLSLVLKQGISINSGGVLFLRLIRVKTSEEQGLSLFPDRDGFVTCPIHAIAVALLMQSAPCASLLAQLPTTNELAEPTIAATIPLLELLGGGCQIAAGINQERVLVSAAARAPGVHSYVNRVLKKSAKAAGVESELTSHSFRRGGAQHANGDPQLSAQWIFDRGAWNLTATNKAFAYVFNTTNEDQKIARVLGGWKANEHVPSVELSVFDTQTRANIAKVQALMYSTCSNLNAASFNVDQCVLDHCAAHLIRHYPQLKMLNSKAPAVKRLEECALAANCQVADLIVWSMKLNEAAPMANVNEDKACNMTDQQKSEGYQATIKYQAAVISGLIEMNKRWEQRIDAIESEMKKRRANIMKEPDSCEASVEDACQITSPKKKKKKTATTHLSTVWYEWYTREPRLWKSDATRQQVSNSRNTVAFMKLFLDEGLHLVEGATDFKEAVMAYGVRAETAVSEFLAGRGIYAQGADSVLKHMREAHRGGALNDRVRAYRARLGAGGIADPAPLKSQDILKVCE